MVLCEELTGRAETPDLFFIRARGIPACAEEFGWLVFSKGMGLVVRAYGAVLPADLPVLLRIFRNILGGVYHDECVVQCRIIGFPGAFGNPNINPLKESLSRLSYGILRDQYLRPDAGNRF